MSLENLRREQLVNRLKLCFYCPNLEIAFVEEKQILQELGEIEAQIRKVNRNEKFKCYVLKPQVEYVDHI